MSIAKGIAMLSIMYSHVRGYGGLLTGGIGMFRRGSIMYFSFFSLWPLIFAPDWNELLET